MIIKTFDQGWGPEHPLKQYEQQIVTDLLKNIVDSNQRTVMINSVWYTTEFHQQVLNWLRTNDWDQIVLVAMLDAAIPNPRDYAEFDRPVIGLGYYPGPGQLDFCALFVDYYLQSPSQNILLDASSIDTAYMCLNRKPHWHRKQLYGRLVAADVVKHGLVSMGGEAGHAESVLTQDRTHDDLAPNPGVEHYGIPNDIVSLGHLDNWRRHFVNIVTETFYDINRTGFVSEKIYKPIVGCRPFLVYDPDGGTQWLTQRGFEPYTQDFSDITDLDLSLPHNVPKFLVVLCQQTPAYWQKKFVDLREKILYNNTHFAEYVQQQKSLIEKGIPCPV